MFGKPKAWPTRPRYNVKGDPTMKPIRFMFQLGATALALSAVSGILSVASAQDACEGREKHFIYYATHAVP